MSPLNQRLHLNNLRAADYRRLTVRERKDWCMIGWCFAIGAIVAVVGAAL